MLPRLRTLYDPARFQGAGRRDRYFEGWYFKLVGAGADPHPLAVIPGVSRDDSGGSSHSFVQVIRPGGLVRYFEYPLSAFRWDADRFALRVGPNSFDHHTVALDLHSEALDLRGEVGMDGWHPWPVTLLSPGIMGWYRFVPTMECYHGVLSLDHGLSGSLLADGEPLDFTGGRGYVEKDWGTSFPSAWIWAQSNHFGRAGVSVTLSVARIPWRGSSFTGHIAGVLLDGELHRFATYTGAKLREVHTGADRARIVMQDAHLRLETELERSTTGALKAPVLGVMAGRSDEALDARLHVRLLRRRGGRVETLFTGVGLHAGAEIMDRGQELGLDP
jgi:tocopherol cyclase